MTSPTKSTSVRFLKNRWLRRGLAAAVVVAVMLIGIPLALKYYLVSWLEKNGADRAEISSLRLNPFVGRLQLKGVDVEAGGVSLLHDGAMDIDLSLRALFRKEIRLEKAYYHDLQLVVEELSDGGYRLASYTMQASSEEPAAVTADSPEDVAGAWAFLADKVVLAHCLLTYKTPQLNLQLAIDQAELIRLSTRPEEQAGTFTLLGSINGKKLSLNLGKLAIVPELELAGKVQLEDFDLNELDRLLGEALPTFGGHAGIDGSFSFLARPDDTLRIGWEGRLSVLVPEVGNQAFGVSAGRLGYEGKADVDIPTGKPMKISVDGTLGADLFRLAVPGAQLSMEEESIRISGNTSVVVGNDIQVNHSGELLIGATTVDVQEQHVAHQSFAWQGTVDYLLAGAASNNTVRTDGNLRVVGGGYQGGGVNCGSGTVGWQGQIGFLENSDTPARVTVNGQLDAAGTSLAIAETMLGLASTTLQSDLEIALGDEVGLSGTAGWRGETLHLAIDGSQPLQLDVGTASIADVLAADGGILNVGAIDLETVDAVLPGPLPLVTRVEQISLRELRGEKYRSWQAGKLEMTGGGGTSVRTDGELFRFGQTVLEEIRVDEQAAIIIGRTGLHDFELLGNASAGKAPVSLAGLSLEKFQFDSATGMLCDNITFDALEAELRREKDGQFRIDKELAKMMVAGETENEEVPADTVKSSDQQEKGVPITIDQVATTGNNTITFHDKTQAQPFSTVLNIETLIVGPIDSRRPEEKMNILLDGAFEGRAPLHIAGSVFPFLPKIAAAVDVELKNYPLANLSSYTVQSVGTGLASGQLQLASNLVLADDNLDMKNKVLLKKLETKTVAPELAATLNNKLPIPLDAALAMLRDSERNISLSIPLSGPVSDLDVGLTDIIITALGKAIVPAASGYLVYALGPYGALAYVGMKVGEKMLQINLPPVSFGIGSAELDGENDDYLQRVGKILTDRPETDLQVCPQVGAWEMLDEEARKLYQAQPVAPEQPQLEQLLQLGEQRGEAIKKHLSDRYGIEAKRLLICDTQVLEDPKQEPKVLLQM